MFQGKGIDFSRAGKDAGAISHSTLPEAVRSAKRGTKQKTQLRSFVTSQLRSFFPLVMPQRDQRVDAGRAMRGDQASCGNDCGHDCADN